MVNGYPLPLIREFQSEDLRGHLQCDKWRMCSLFSLSLCIYEYNLLQMTLFLMSTLFQIWPMSASSIWFLYTFATCPLVFEYFLAFSDCKTFQANFVLFLLMCLRISHFSRRWFLSPPRYLKTRMKMLSITVATGVALIPDNFKGCSLIRSLYQYAQVRCRYQRVFSPLTSLIFYL